MTEVKYNELDLALPQVIGVLENNYNISGDWEYKKIDEFFNDIAEGTPQRCGGYTFKMVDYNEPFGNGVKTLIFEVTRYSPYSSYSRVGDRYSGLFSITGYFNSWDNGDGDGYWEGNFMKVTPQKVEKVEYVAVTDAD